MKYFIFSNLIIIWNFQVQTPEKLMQEIEAKRKLRASEGAHFFYTLIFLVSSGLIQMKYSNLQCGVDYNLIINLFFYGLVIWATYILITILPRYKNTAIKTFFNFLDITFGVYVLGLYMYALVLFFSPDNDCEAKAPILAFFINVFLIVNSVVFAVLLLALVSFLLRRWSKAKFDYEDNYQD